ncbi:hybrid sensor histidine kinase/response regulator [Microcoleus vaginatus PCC 9802]|uniref:hybrid sensor histidine kinase/response regulator n=1 Tax=Microcoleus vaginatus TaxID=119532 RepID=UPI00020D29E2|nr:response regulator receiver sensor signal transduction histidine kinase [Microcoleus vaginatus FGP-2]UNU18130.1 hybrid sensor histidine kinase/response regulator [Microcoleus vaginatus PCC 9802]
MNPIQILVVEDEVIVAQDIAGRLKKLGYVVTATVSSGEEAIQKAIEKPPDLVLMDIVLKGDMDGVTAAEKIRTHRNVPTVFLTAYADDKTLQRAKLTDPFGYIIKPFQQNDLRVAIEIAMHRHEIETKMRESLKAAEAARESVEEKSHRQNQYISMAAHELRNPLNAILISAELLDLDRTRSSDESQVRTLRLVHSATQKMNQLIDDMLFMGRAESGQLKCNPLPINLVEFCQDLLAQLQLGNEAKHKLTLIPSDVTSAMLDQQLLHGIISNLIVNAIKYSPNGGQVTLELECRRASEGDKEAIFGLCPQCLFPNSQFTNINSPLLILRIRDEGMGIPETEVGKIFEMFYRCKNTVKIKGNGLGLTIVKKAVELQGGAIACESKMGIGTTFTVALPYVALSCKTQRQTT